MSNDIIASVLAKEFVAAGQGTVANDPTYSNLTVTHGQSGHVEWTIILPAAGHYRLHALMTAAEARPCVLSINGEQQASPILGEVTGSWHRDTLQWFEYGPYPFKQGENRFRIDFSEYQPHLQEFGFSLAVPQSVEASVDVEALGGEVEALQAAYQAALADPLNYLCRLEVAVDEEWKGVHVQNQSQANGTALVRHSGLGNRVRFVRSPQVDGGFQIAVDVKSTWKTVQIKDQLADDYAVLIRASGDGNIFKIEDQGDGVYHLLAQVGGDYSEWKGVHVYNQSAADNSGLIRHTGAGNAFHLVATDKLAEPERIEALQSLWLGKQAEYERLRQSLPESVAPALAAANVDEVVAAESGQAAETNAEAVTSQPASAHVAPAVIAEQPDRAAPPPSADQQALNLLKLYEEGIVPGSSLLMQGNIVEGSAHTALWLGLRLAGGLAGSVGWVVLAANSYSRSVSGKHLHQHVAAFLDRSAK